MNISGRKYSYYAAPKVESSVCPWSLTNRQVIWQDNYDDTITSEKTMENDVARLLLNKTLVLVDPGYKPAEFDGKRLQIGDQIVIKEIRLVNSRWVINGKSESIYFPLFAVLPDAKNIEGCTCDSQTLFRCGCKCGYFVRMKKLKQTK